MSAEELARAAAAAQLTEDAMAVDTPLEPPTQTGPVDGSLPDVGTGSAIPTLQEMMGMMKGIMKMMAEDK